jgi:aryl-alcohol dehydrogenase-like predicted oxidoreductase
METRTLGTSTLAVSVVGIGCNNLGRAGTTTEDQTGTTAVVRSALDAGVTLFDTADIYGKEWGLSETLLGAALQGRRDEAVVATKFGAGGGSSPLAALGPAGSRPYIRAAVEASLGRLRTDRIDLFQLHMPDAETPMDDTLEALGELVQEGKVLEIGHSNFDGTMLRGADAAAAALGTPRFVSAQNHYSLLAREAEVDLLPAAEELGVGFLPYFPLANGLLTGKFSRTERPADSRIARSKPEIADQAPWDALEAFAAFAAERGISMLEATFGWLLSRPALSSVIAGATTPGQVAQNAAAGDGWRPSGADLVEIDGFFPRTATA